MNYKTKSLAISYIMPLWPTTNVSKSSISKTASFALLKSLKLFGHMLRFIILVIKHISLHLDHHLHFISPFIRSFHSHIHINYTIHLACIIVLYIILGIVWFHQHMENVHMHNMDNSLSRFYIILFPTLFSPRLIYSFHFILICSVAWVELNCFSADCAYYYRHTTGTKGQRKNEGKVMGHWREWLWRKGNKSSGKRKDDVVKLVVHIKHKVLLSHISLLLFFLLSCSFSLVGENESAFHFSFAHLLLSLHFTHFTFKNT